MMNYDILLKEYELHRAELKMRIEHRMKGFIFLLSASSLIFSVGLKDNVGLVFFILPWVVLSFFAYLGHQMMCAQLTVAYLKDLERRLNSLDYERSITSQLWHDRKFYNNPNSLLLIVSIIPFIFIYLYCLYKASYWLAGMQNRIVYFIYFILIGLATSIVPLIIRWGIKESSVLPTTRAYKEIA